jgi:Tfp pilus assembly protein PilN
LQVSVFLLFIPAIILALGGVYMKQNRRVDELLEEKERLKAKWEVQQNVLAKFHLQEQTATILEGRVSLITDLIKERSGPIQLLDQIINRTPSSQLWLTGLTQQQETVQELVMAPPAAPAAKPAAELEPAAKPAKPAAKAAAKPAAKAAPATGRAAMIKVDITAPLAAKKAAVKLEPRLEQVTKNQLTLQGVARDNFAIAQYIQTLEGSDLLTGVALTISQETIIDGFRLKKFTIKATVDYARLRQKEGEAAAAPASGGESK